MAPQVTPIYASAPPEDGGLGLSSSQLSAPLFAHGVALLLFSVLCFRRAERALGVRRLEHLALLASSIFWMMMPAASLAMPSTAGAMLILCAAHIGKALCQSCTFTCAFVLINISAPPEQLGRVNGVGQSVASFVRTAGPTAGGFTWALTLGSGLPYHQFIVYSGIALTSLCAAAVYGSHLKIPALEGRSEA